MSFQLFKNISCSSYFNSSILFFEKKLYIKSILIDLQFDMLQSMLKSDKLYQFFVKVQMLKFHSLSFN